MRCKAEVGESNIGLFRLPLASFPESSGFSVCSYSEADTGPFPTPIWVGWSLFVAAVVPFRA
jgi:hypothetical protein